MKKFKHIQCRETLKTVRPIPGTDRVTSICGSHLGDLEVGKEVSVRFLCRRHADHARPVRIVEVRQNNTGAIVMRGLDKNERSEYCDDAVRTVE